MGPINIAKENAAWTGVRNYVVNRAATRAAFEAEDPTTAGPWQYKWLSEETDGSINSTRCNNVNVSGAAYCQANPETDTQPCGRPKTFDLYCCPPGTSSAPEALKQCKA
ncbi:hypothetical protein SBOR_1037 [Sclerotinia borealis F-4128]|uniref:Uncharacterized protein n=1 Tax=Sclerotinia borealis (strain F-4128) TaxID=1432307 RepID=W9CP37_SCLBF|nr:hypothetical protein SBOR_1037 [Sclerotinia borealis F-4128]